MVAPLFQETNLPKLIVQGVILNQDGEPWIDLSVKAFDRNIGTNDTLLGQTTTNSDGKYSISYSSTQLDGKIAADLVIEVLRDTTLLESSDVIFNANPFETRDFVIQEVQAPEFQRLVDRIEPLLQDKLHQGDLERQQISFLIKKK